MYLGKDSEHTFARNIYLTKIFGKSKIKTFKNLKNRYSVYMAIFPLLFTL